MGYELWVMGYVLQVMGLNICSSGTFPTDFIMFISYICLFYLLNLNVCFYINIIQIMQDAVWSCSGCKTSVLLPKACGIPPLVLLFNSWRFVNLSTLSTNVTFGLIKISGNADRSTARLTAYININTHTFLCDIKQWDCITNITPFQETVGC